MQVAEIIASMLGTDVPVRVLGYDGSKAGPDSSELALRIISPRALARLATAPGTLGLARAYVTGEIEVEGDLYALLAAMADLTINDLGRADQLRLAPAHGADLAAAPPARRPRWSTARRAGGCTPSCATRRPSRTTTTSPTASTSGCSGRRWPTRARCYPTASSTLEEAQAAKYELVRAEARARAGHAAARRRLRLGRHGHARRGRARGARRSASRSRATRPSGRRRRSSAAGSAASPRCATSTTATRRSRSSTPSARSGSPSTSAGPTCRPTSRRCTPGCGRRVGCSTTASPSRAHRRSAARPVHRPLRLPRRPAGGGRPDHRRDERRRASRCATRRTCASTTRSPCARGARNLEEHWDEAVAEVGDGRARVWRLYMAACALGFERDNIQLHQVLGVRLSGHGGSGFPLRGWR